MEAFNGHAPHSLVRGKTVRDLLERDRCATLLRSSKGLMRAGELTTAMAWCNEAMNLVKERSARLGPRLGPQADEMWMYTKALCKVKLEQCRAPAGFEEDGTRASVEGRNALGLNTVLSYLMKNWRRGEAAKDLREFPAEAAECAAMVGRVAAALSPIVEHLHDDVVPVGDGRALSKLALDSFEEAVEISKSRKGTDDNEARGGRRLPFAWRFTATSCSNLRMIRNPPIWDWSRRWSVTRYWRSPGARPVSRARVISYPGCSPS